MGRGCGNSSCTPESQDKKKENHVKLQIPKKIINGRRVNTTVHWVSDQHNKDKTFLSPALHCIFPPFLSLFPPVQTVQHSLRRKQSALNAENKPAHQPVKEITSSLPHFATTGTPHRALTFFHFKGANTPPTKPSLSNKERLSLLIC